MDVYIVPVGPDRHELYCEVPDEPDTETGDAAGGSDSPEPRGFLRRLRAWPRGFFRRMRASFREMLAEAERERRLERAGAGGPAERKGEGWLARAKARLMRWVAESIAEQRLLWHLRSQTAACLFYPDDIDEAARDGRPAFPAPERLREASLLADARHHRVHRFRGVLLRTRAQHRRLLFCLPSRRSLSLDARRAARIVGGDRGAPNAARHSPSSVERLRSTPRRATSRCRTSPSACGSSIWRASSNEPRYRSPSWRTPNSELRTPNAERRTPNAERRTRTPNRV